MKKIVLLYRYDKMTKKKKKKKKKKKEYYSSLLKIFSLIIINI